MSENKWKGREVLHKGKVYKVLRYSRRLDGGWVILQAGYFKRFAVRPDEVTVLKSAEKSSRKFLQGIENKGNQ